MSFSLAEALRSQTGHFFPGGNAIQEFHDRVQNTTLLNSGGKSMTTAILRLVAVKMRTGLSRSSIYSWIAKGQLPAQVSLGARAVGWVESKVDEWLACRIAESREKRSGGT